MEERRKQRRIRVARKAYLSDLDRRFYFFGFVRDASRTGCRIYTTEALDLPDQIWLYPVDLNVPLFGVVAWRRRHMAGVRIIPDPASVLGAEGSRMVVPPMPDFEEIEQNITARTMAQREARRQPAVVDDSRPDRLARLMRGLRSPINAITGALTLLAARAITFLPPKYRALLSMAGHSARHVETAVGAALDTGGRPRKG